jgi:PAS domain S-box-containing protein
VRLLVSLAAIGITAFLVIENQAAAAATREKAELLDLTHDTIFVRDMNDVVAYWNRGAEALYGIAREQAIGSVAHSLLQTSFPAPLADITRDLLRTGRWEGELVQTTRGGQQLVVASRWALQRDKQGRAIGILETNTDITARKRAEERLVAAERELRATIDTLPALIWASSAVDGEVDFLSARWAELGYPLEDLRGDGLRRILHPDDLARSQAESAAAFAAGRPFDVERRMRLAAGGYRWFHMRAAPRVSDDGEIVRWYGIDTDIEDRKRAEQALQSVQAELAHVTRVATLGEFAASIAHEVNQPLAAVVTNGEVCLRWLDRDVPDLAEVREAVVDIIANGRRASDIVHRLRALSRKQETEKVALDINEAIEDVVPLVGREALGNRVALAFELAPGLPPVLADRVQLQQVIINLIVNGMEAMAGVTDRPRRLVVRTGRDAAGLALVAVEDAGSGFAPGQERQIFEPFFTTKPGGMGMGLAICRSIVESFGGRLWASPNAVHGATVQFVLPVIEEHGA